jgi:hypothetical protein
MTFEKWWSENRDGAFFSKKKMVQEAWDAAQAEERVRERGKALAAGFDDRYAATVDALVVERERSRVLLSTLRAVLAVSERRHTRDMSVITSCVKFAIAKYEEGI